MATKVFRASRIATMQDASALCLGEGSFPGATWLSHRFVIRAINVKAAFSTSAISFLFSMERNSCLGLRTRRFGFRRVNRLCVTFKCWRRPCSAYPYGAKRSYAAKPPGLKSIKACDGSNNYNTYRYNKVNQYIVSEQPCVTKKSASALK